ncbi:hypothetical protein D3C85_1265110 [compost metagenome]
MIEFHADVAHQPAPRHVFAGVAGEAGLGQVLRHIQGELLDDRPAADQVQAQGPGTERGVTHALVELMLDDPALALAAVLDKLAGPGRIAAELHQWTGPAERIYHWRLL